MTVEELECTALLRIDGDIDLATVEELSAGVRQVDLDRIALLVIDLQDVEFLDLSGVNALLRARDECESRGVKLAVIGPRGPAGRVLGYIGADEELDIIDSGGDSGR